MPSDASPMRQAVLCFATGELPRPDHRVHASRHSFTKMTEDDTTFASNGGAPPSSTDAVDVGVKRPLVGEEEAVQVEEVDDELARRGPKEDGEPADSAEKVRGGMRRAPQTRTHGDSADLGKALGGSVECGQRSQSPSPTRPTRSTAWYARCGFSCIGLALPRRRVEKRWEAAWGVRRAAGAYRWVCTSVQACGARLDPWSCRRVTSRGACRSWISGSSCPLKPPAQQR
jgi:hypothetical protein